MTSQVDTDWSHFGSSIFLLTFYALFYNFCGAPESPLEGQGRIPSGH